MNNGRISGFQDLISEKFVNNLLNFFFKLFSGSQDFGIGLAKKVNNLLNCSFFLLIFSELRKDFRISGSD